MAETLLLEARAAGGNRVVPPLNRAIVAFADAGLPIFATRDWHPPDTAHFQTAGGPWPVHCVRDTRRASPRVRASAKAASFT